MRLSSITITNHLNLLEYRNKVVMPIFFFFFLFCGRDAVGPESNQEMLAVTLCSCRPDGSKYLVDRHSCAWKRTASYKVNQGSARGTQL